MPIYRMKIEGRTSSVLVKADSAAKAKDLFVEATSLTGAEIADAMGDGETVWKPGSPLPDDAAPTIEVKEKQDSNPPAVTSKSDSVS